MQLNLRRFYSACALCASAPSGGTFLPLPDGGVVSLVIGKKGDISYCSVYLVCGPSLAAMFDDLREEFSRVDHRQGIQSS